MNINIVLTKYLMYLVFKLGGKMKTLCLILTFATLVSCGGDDGDSKRNPANNTPVTLSANSAWSSCEVYDKTQQRYIDCRAVKANKNMASFKEQMSDQCDQIDANENFEAHYTENSLCPLSRGDVLNQTCVNETNIAGIKLEMLVSILPADDEDLSSTIESAKEVCSMANGKMGSKTRWFVY